MGPPSTLTCQYNLDTVIRIYNHLGVPLALEKGEVQQPPCLFWVIFWIPLGWKLGYLRTNCVNYRKNLSLVGSLQHATKIVCCGTYVDFFVSCMYATVAKVKEMYFHTRLNLEFQSDLCWGHTFLTDWNGLSLLHWDDGSWTPNHVIQMDASKHMVVGPFGRDNGSSGVGC